MPLSLAMIPLSGQVRISVPEMQRDLKTTWPGTPAAVDVHREHGILTFTLGKAFVAIALMPGPIAWQDLEPRCKRSWLWPDAETSLKNHTQHFVITLDSEASPRDRAAKLTKICASVAAHCDAALGVMFGEPGVLARKEIFRDLAVESLRTSLPVELWIDCIVGKMSGDRSQGYTRGLTQLGHPELEAKGIPESPERLHRRLIAVSRYLVEHGPIVQEGDAVGQSEEERIHASFGHSEFGLKGTVMRLVYE